MRVFVSMLLVTLLASCTTASGVGGGSGAAPSAMPAGPAGSDLAIERIVTGLEGPTQMIEGPDRRLWVAQLAGSENAGTGQVVAVDLDSGRREVLLDGLTKPTGIAWVADALWIATPTQLVRASGNPPSQPEVVLSDLPNNGRSNGTLTVTPQGRLLFETSGRERDGGAVTGSGALWVIDPRMPQRPLRRVASGLKNAYAHVYDRAGRLWSTEVAEPLGGTPAPDEINRITPGRLRDHGWPACVGDRQPVSAFGGSADRCALTARPLATIAPGATPTAIVISPFDDSRFAVALWNAGRVVTVPADGVGPPEDLVTGIERPQHLLVDGDGLLVSDHATGAIWRVRAG